MEITQESLAEQLQVSRMPVRQALQTLEMECYIQRLPNRRLKIIGDTETNRTTRLQLYTSIETQAVLHIHKTKHFNDLVATLTSQVTGDLLSVETEIDFHDRLFTTTDDALYTQLYRSFIRPSLFVLITIEQGNRQRAELLNALIMSFQNDDVDGICKIITKYYQAFDMTKKYLI